MKVLKSSAQIRQKIQTMFSAAKGRRIAVTAFVGDGAEDYLSRPKGITLICWPKEGGTNPYTLWELKRRGVKVKFSDRLHAKLYWTEDKGVIITSANLSISAMGAGGLKEFGVWLPSRAVDIDEFIKTIDPRMARDSEIKKLERRHKKYTKRNPQSYPPTQKKSYADWYKMKRPEWKLANIIVANIRLSKSSRALLKKEYGKNTCTDFMNVERTGYKEDDWILCFNESNKTGKPIYWMFADHIVEISRTEKGYDKKFPKQVMQVSPIRNYDRPPFLLDKKFRSSFYRSAEEIGGIPHIIIGSRVRPTERFMKLLFKYYIRDG